MASNKKYLIIEEALGELPLSIDDRNALTALFLDCEIGFDVFDTLLYRNLLLSTDLVAFMEYKIPQLCGRYYMLRFLRPQFEILSRQYYKKNYGFEDVSIHEIYDYMGKVGVIEKHHIELLEQLEVVHGYKFLNVRFIGNVLYQLARKLEKTIIFVSDTCFTKEILKDILSKKGFVEYDELYVSSDIRLTKSTGNLFAHVRKLHSKIALAYFGSDEHSDMKMAKKHKISSFLLPRGIDEFFTKDFIKHTFISPKHASEKGVLIYENMLLS